MIEYIGPALIYLGGSLLYLGIFLMSIFLVGVIYNIVFIWVKVQVQVLIFLESYEVTPLVQGIKSPKRREMINKKSFYSYLLFICLPMVWFSICLLHKRIFYEVNKKVSFLIGKELSCQESLCRFEPDLARIYINSPKFFTGKVAIGKVRYLLNIVRLNLSVRFTPFPYIYIILISINTG